MCWPGQDKKEANDSALLYNAAFNSYDKNCGPHAVECAESDLLGECLGALEDLLKCSMATSCADCEFICRVDDDYDNPQDTAKAILAKRKGEGHESII